MKLHISYNAFNGLEFLRPNLLNMRPLADAITVVWQRTSNYGNAATEDIESLVMQLKKQGLIDHEICYQTNPNLGGAMNELSKRKLGLGMAKSLACTHHLDLDVDEFYFPKQVEMAKQFIDKNGYQTTYCPIVEYHKDVLHKSKTLRTDLYAPFIMRADSELVFRTAVPVPIDTKRRAVPHTKHYIFKPNQLLMHHYTLVRQDFSGKFTDANNRKRNKQRIKAVRQFNPNRYQVVDNYFNI